MIDVSEPALGRGDSCHTVEVADQTLSFHPVRIDDLTPNGAQLAAAAGFKSAEGVIVLQVLANGELDDIQPSEVVDVRHLEGRFVIVESDRTYRLTLDGESFDWPCRAISGGTLRKLGNVSNDTAIYFEQESDADRSEYILSTAKLQSQTASDHEGWGCPRLPWWTPWPKRERPPRGGLLITL